MQKQYMVGQATFAEVEELIKFSQQFLPEASFDKDQITSYWLCCIKPAWKAYSAI